MKHAFLLLCGLALGPLTGLYCAPAAPGVPLAPRDNEPTLSENAALVVRFAHITDTHAIDTLSPARFTEAYVVTSSAWRPFEAYSMQLLDGIIRAVNRIHAGGRPIDFLLHTGDACDNAQTNESAWFLTVMDGGIVNPLSGPDDRSTEDKPAELLDPYAVFDAQGLYQKGRHGELDSIPWYFTFGNHDRYAVGVLPIFEDASGRRSAPVPLPARPGLLLPTSLNPTSSRAAGRVTPADPGPPLLFERPLYVEPNDERAYSRKSEFAARLENTVTGPASHGFAGVQNEDFWYSVIVAPRVRLIGLDTTDRSDPRPAEFCDEGALSRRQLDFLRAELNRAAENDELAIVATHHPSTSLNFASGSEVSGTEFRAALNEYPNVVLHIAGHKHRNRVTDHNSYLEIETCSTLDLPQEGRLIELWREPETDQIMIAYEMFSHLDDETPPLGPDPLQALRAQAHAIAAGDKDAAARQRRFDPEDVDPRGRNRDRSGLIRLRR